jgi:acyl carrier protein
MTTDHVRAAVLQALFAVAPEADHAGLRPDVAFRDQLDIDSMDILRFVIELKRGLGVDIPERDYPELASLDSTTGYLTRRLAQQA